MKNQLICLCVGILSFCTVPALSQVADLSKSNYGIWQTFGDPLSLSVNPEVRGRLCNFRWAELEPSNNQWEWKQFDSNLAVRAKDGLPIIFMVYTKEDAPEWIYSNGVPKVSEKDRKGDVIGFAPYFADSDYKTYFKRMITTVRKHVETLPDSVRSKIIAVQACLGSTGDYISYKGDVDPQYQISNAGFYDLFKEFTQFYFDEYNQTNPKISLLSNPKNNGPDQAFWLMSNCPGSWIKTGSIGKAYQLNDEVSKSSWLYPMINEKNTDDEYVRARSEIIGGATGSGWWLKAPYKNMFAMMCYGIYWGLDWSNQGYDQISDKSYDSSFGFYNKYAGEKDPSQSAYAMCALRQGLDASDAAKFPVAQYGAAQRSNSTRYQNIANAYAAYGAKLEDVANAVGTELDNIGSRGINDVGWDVFEGNYDRYLHQINADVTSAGYWNIESTDRKDMYGKYGRGFDLAKGKDALYFNVEDAFLDNAALNSKHPVVLEVVYFDNGTGSWQLFYDAATNANKASLQVTCTNTKLWKRASLTINDAYFGNRGFNTADFYIKNTGTENVIFSIVEIRQPYDNEVAGFSSSNLNPFESTCTGGTAYQTLYVNGSFLDGQDVTVGPLSGFRFSIDSGKTYPDSIIIKNYGGQFSQKIFVEFNPQSDGSFNGNISVKGSNALPIAIPVVASAINSAPALDTVITPISCNGRKDAAIDITCKNGNGPFTYSWSGPANFKATTEDISALQPGDYTITISSKAACKYIQKFTIADPKKLVLELSAEPIFCKNGTTNVDVKATGGTMPYDGTGSFIVEAGVKQYKIADANGCTATESINIANGTQQAPPAPQIIYSADADAKGVCGGGLFSFAVAPVAASTGYTWTLPSGSTITSSNIDSSEIAVNIPSNFKTGIILASAKNNCGAGIPVIKNLVTAPGIPGAINGPINIQAQQSGLIYSVDPAINGLDYTWELPATATLQSGQHTPTIVAAWGNLSSKIKITASNSCGTSAPKVLEVNVVSKTTLSVSATVANDILCHGGFTSVTVTATGATAPYTGTGNFMALAGTHTYEVTDAKGTKSSVTINIDEPFALNVVAQEGIISCNNGNTDINVSASGGTAPYTGTGNFSVKAGVHTYTIEDANGCPAVKTINLTEPSPLNITAHAEPLAEGEINTTVEIVATGGTSPYMGTGIFTVRTGFYTYQVTDAGGCSKSVDVNIDSAITNPSVLTSSFTKETIACHGGTTTVTVNAKGGTAPYTGIGTYTVSAGKFTFTVRDALGQVCTQTITINEPETLKAESGVNDITCNGGTTILNVWASGGTLPYKGTGSFLVNAGTYNYTVSDANGCTTNTLVQAKEPEILKINSITRANAASCNGGNGALIINTSGGTSPYQFNLNAGTYQLSNAFSDLLEGPYTVIVKDNNGCTASAPAVVQKSAPMKAWLSDINHVSSCGLADGNITIANEGGFAPYQYGINGGDFKSSNIFENLPQGNYTVAIKDSRGCETSASTTIKKDAALTITISTVLSATACNANSGYLVVNAVGGSSRYQFSLNGGAYQTSNIFEDLTAGLYTIKVKDSRGCTNSVSATISQASLLTVAVSSVNNASVCSNLDGSIKVITEGGEGQYLYSINGSNFSPESSFTNLSAGLYKITVLDSRGCTAYVTATISKPAEITFTAQKTDVSCKGLADGNISIKCNGGTAPYKFSIDNNPADMQNVFTNLKAGIHNITVHDSKNCTIIISINIAEGTVECNAATNINDSAPKLILKAYPNPSPDEFMLAVKSNSTSEVNIIVTDNSGRVVYTAKGSVQEQFRFGKSFISGMYIVRVIQDNHIQTQKLIKTRGL